MIYWIIWGSQIAQRMSFLKLRNDYRNHSDELEGSRVGHKLMVLEMVAP